MLQIPSTTTKLFELTKPKWSLLASKKWLCGNRSGQDSFNQAFKAASKYCRCLTEIECTGHLCSKISVTGWRISDIRVRLNLIRLSGIDCFSAVLSYEKIFFIFYFYKSFLTAGDEI